MTSDDHDKPVKRPSRRDDIKRIEELYRQSDSLHGGFKEGEPGEFQKRESARHRSLESRDDQDNQSKLSKSMIKHGTILDALTDIARYAKDERLHLVSDCIEGARSRIQEILSSEESNKRPGFIVYYSDGDDEK